MKKLISALAAVVATCVAATSLVANAALIDPSGNDGITASDSLYIQQFLAGMIPSYNLNSVDVDMNGIVSKMDSDKILSYLTNRDNPLLPDAPANYDTTTISTIESRSYRKHNYSSVVATSYSRYTINQSSFNTASADSDCMPFTIIGDNNMVRDTDSAVVRLCNVGGTGFIIGDHIIATAAHCVYDKKTKTFKDNNIEIVDENNNVIDSFHAASVHIPEDYVLDRSYNLYDYALLYVPSVDLSDYGMFSLGVAKDEFVTDSRKQVVISGFPQEYPDGYGSDPCEIRFKAAGNIFFSIRCK